MCWLQIHVAQPYNHLNETLRKGFGHFSALLSTSVEVMCIGCDPQFRKWNTKIVISIILKTNFINFILEPKDKNYKMLVLSDCRDPEKVEPASANVNNTLQSPSAESSRPYIQVMSSRLNLHTRVKQSQRRTDLLTVWPKILCLSLHTCAYLQNQF